MASETKTIKMLGNVLYRTKNNSGVLDQMIKVCRVTISLKVSMSEVNLCDHNSKYQLELAS